MKKRVFLVALFIGIVAIPIALFVRVRMAERAWERSLGDLEPAPRQFPEVKKNEAAEKIAGWLSELGGEDQDLMSAVAKYISAANTSDEPAPPPPPPVIAFYAEQQAAALDRMANWIANHPAPSWPPQIVEPIASLDGLLPTLKLARFLLAAAYVRESQGDSRGAERLLQAVWKLNTGMRVRPELTSQLIAVAIARMQNTAARKIHVDPVAWQERLGDHDYRASVRRSITVQTWRKIRDVKSNVHADPAFIAASRAFQDDGGASVRPRWLILLTTPVRWFDLPALVEGNRELILEASRLPVSDSSPEALDRAYSRGFSRWSFIPEPDMNEGSLSRAFQRVDAVIAETEFAQRVVMARAARTASGRWPPAIDGFSESRIENGRWLYELSGDVLTIRFSRELHWPRLHGDSIPLHVTLK